MAALRYLPDVVTLELDRDKCVGCGLCATVCPHGVFRVEDGKARMADRDACMECGACARNCPVAAISVRSGVGCAAGILAGALRGKEPCCGGPDGKGCCG
jgi:ferredoxin